jgi:hypothetical protein
MALTMRRAGLSSGIDQDRADYTVYSGGWAVGRIYQTRGGPDSLRWFWSVTVNGPMTRSDRVADVGGGQGAVSEELGCLEGVGEAGRGRLSRIIRAALSMVGRARNLTPGQRTRIVARARGILGR